MRDMKLALTALIFLAACVVHAGADESDIRSHRSVVISNLVAESDVIIRGTLADGIMGEIDGEGDAIFFVYVDITEVLKKPVLPKRENSPDSNTPPPIDPFAPPGSAAPKAIRAQYTPFPHDRLVKGKRIQILWYTQQNGATDDKVALPQKTGEKGIFFLRTRKNKMINTDKWFSYHPDNTKLVEEIRHRTR
jgi:hypothetical protein